MIKNTLMNGKKYFFEEISYTMSGLKTVDSRLLDCARPYLYYTVTSTWIQQFAAFLRKKQKEIICANKRVSAVEINEVFPKDGMVLGDRKTAQIQCGGWSARFVLIREDETSFQEPLF